MSELSFRTAGAPVALDLGAAPEGVDVHALALALGCPALLESGAAPRERWHVLPLSPRGTLTTREGSGTLTWDGQGAPLALEGRGLDHLRALLRGLAVPRPAQELAFAAGLVVVLGYDLAHEVERLPMTTEDRDGWPWLHALACPAALLVDLHAGRLLLAHVPDEDGGSGALPWGLTRAEADALAFQVRAALDGPGGVAHGRPLGDVAALTSDEGYRAMVRAVKERLEAGDIYQANVSQRFEVPWEGDARALHAVLRLTNPSPFSGWMHGPGWELVSGSPERLVRLVGRELVTEPIAGTMPLPDGPATTDSRARELTEELVRSGKDRAEHVMIVDIHRNDLGRVAAPGTVRVEEMMRVDRRSHVLQAVADIRGTLDRGKGAVDVVEAVFPGGCITGVPKVSCMEILDRVERVRRGPYTGSFGMLTAWGDLDLNVLIRSAWRVGGRLAFQAGGGVVLDSDPERERVESLAKARALLDAVSRVR